MSPLLSIFDGSGRQVPCALIRPWGRMLLCGCAEREEGQEMPTWDTWGRHTVSRKEIGDGKTD